MLNEFAFVFNFSHCVIPLLNSRLIYRNSITKQGFWHLSLSFSCFIVNLVFTNWCVLVRHCVFEIVVVMTV